MADRPGDLTSGTLHAAKLTQLSAAAGGRFEVEWVALGHGRGEELLTVREGCGCMLRVVGWLFG